MVLQTRQVKEARRWRPQTGASFSDQPGNFQPSQSQTARPITSSRSRPLSHGISSVNIVTHCFHEHGIRVMSVPQKLRSGLKVSTIDRKSKRLNSSHLGISYAVFCLKNKKR